MNCYKFNVGVIPNMPRAFGDAMIRATCIDIFCEDNSPLIEAHYTEPDPIEVAIGRNVAALIDDGATLQMGIGAIPNAVLSQLGNHKNLGVHTEMFADGILPLVEKGVVNEAMIGIDVGKMTSTFLMGSKKLYDFVRGASMSPGGKPIIAMPSVTQKGMSKIAPMLHLGAGVVTTRSNMHWMVTEFGSVNLYGKSLQERAKPIISIAHPNHQESLDKSAFERFGPHYHFVS